jgi:glycosyltransferase involved in cell wall biosynthesis
MKVLIISAADIIGGAHKAAYRLHRALLDNNISSQMLVQNKVSDEYQIIGPTSNFRKRVFNPLRPAFDYILMKINKIDTLFSSSFLPFSEIIKQIDRIKPDLVHLHWITGGMMRIEDIAKIKYPIIWSLHDMWAFTGGCHYDNDCGLYRQNCGNCKMIPNGKKYDLSRIVFNRKRKTYSQIRNITFVATSRWLAKCAQDSTLLKNKNIHILPNPIDTNLFKPLNKNISRELFKIPKNKKVILYSALHSLKDKRKGAVELFEAINMTNLEDTVIVVAGSSQPKEFKKQKYPVFFIPPLKDELSLPMLYNIADIMIAPSLQENLANSILENLACGVPVVAFDIGGNSDLIEHKKNGYLAKNKSPKSLANGINWTLKKQNHELLSKNAIQSIKKFNYKNLSKRYISLYRQTLGLE